jgi:SsrA-binding protein
LSEAIFKPKVEFVNRRATHEYFFDQQFEAGLLLSGTEIKSIRKGSVNLNDAYCYFEESELFVRSLFIGEYEQGNQFNHEPRRPRKLLLRRTELRKLEKKVKERGFTIVPYRLFINEKGRAKLEIALARGKKSFDKRETIKEKDNKREMDRLKKIRLK